jgi:hypothetical protein
MAYDHVYINQKVEFRIDIKQHITLYISDNIIVSFYQIRVVVNKSKIMLR